MSLLSQAKSMIEEHRFQEGIAVLEKIVREQTSDSAEAAYCLGLIHHKGSGVPQDEDKAVMYYRLAEQSRHPLAALQLGGVYYRRDEFQKAYDSFRLAAPVVPSAAYWTYRTLTKDSRLSADPNAALRYLRSAAELGHVVAKRDVAIRYASGKEGLLRIPYGILLYIKVIVDLMRAVVIKNETMKYQ
jgi:TPR repeat protein